MEFGGMLAGLMGCRMANRNQSMAVGRAESA